MSIKKSAVAEHVSAMYGQKQGHDRGLVLIDLEETKAKVGAKSDSVIYDWIKTKGFPAPVRGSRRFARWVLGEVDGWILAKIKERDEAARDRAAA